ncbi:hypothetical protein GCM10023143_25240 [Compostibacter hankyongensis]|uniref:BZIP transcription factor n=2 Tax=Compostibacter hankyongensis TaxID=1007089 RepID=A0ABP8FZU3_9BACT
MMPSATFGQTNIFPATGKVGIGTVTPTTDLEVRNDVASDIGPTLLLHNNQYANSIGAGASLKFIGALSDRYISLESVMRVNALPDRLDFKFNNDGSIITPLTITYSGNVGVGTLTPHTPLEISGAGQHILFGGGTNSSGYSLQMSLNDDGVNMENSSSIRGYNFKNYNGTLMTITSAGNVGIGTISPNAKLAVNGSVSAKKITVTQNGWPDYVFAPEYSLPSLDSLNAYLRKRRHLPDLPSAAEISKKGNDLGQTDALLLKKIEELTLYVIKLNEQQTSQQSQINVLSRENAALRQKNDALESAITTSIKRKR